MTNAKHVVDDLKSLIAGREVDSRDIGDLGELGGSVVLEEANHGKDTSGSGIHCELILPHCELLDIFGQTRHNVLPICVKAVGHGLVLVGRVDHGGAQRSRGWQNTVRLAQFVLSIGSSIAHTRALRLAHVLRFRARCCRGLGGPLKGGGGKRAGGHGPRGGCHRASRTQAHQRACGGHCVEGAMADAT